MGFSRYGNTFHYFSVVFLGLVPRKKEHTGNIRSCVLKGNHNGNTLHCASLSFFSADLVFRCARTKLFCYRSLRVLSLVSFEYFRF